MPDRELTDGTKKWLDDLAAADGYMFVTAEYNHAVPAVLKNAIDITTGQLVRKPAGIVSHGVVGGARSSEQLRQVLGSKVGAAVVPDAVTFHGMVDGSILEDGTLAAGAEQNITALDAHIDDLLWYTTALKTARS